MRRATRRRKLKNGPRRAFARVERLLERDVAARRPLPLKRSARVCGLELSVRIDRAEPEYDLDELW